MRECGFEWEIETSYKSLFTLLDFKFYFFQITPFFNNYKQDNQNQ